MKKSLYIKNFSLRHVICLLILHLMFSLPVVAQISSENLYGSLVIGANPTFMYGDLTIMPTGELYLGSHAPRGLQTNTLIMYGNYVGESGSRLYTSVIDNSNQSGTRGFLDINGTANKVGNEGTSIELDMHSNWNGACIDLVRAHEYGSDVNTFRMNEANYSGHTAYLKVRHNGNDLIWYIAEKIIIAQQTFEQSLCKNDPVGFEPLIVQTSSNNFTYQWYRCNADGSNPVNLGSANGAQTAVYTPPVNMQTGTYYYYCIVTSILCEYNSDTTDISGRITLFSPIEIITQPHDEYICNGGGGNVTLSVVVSGDVSSYQWYKNGAAVANSNTPDLEVTIVAGERDRYYVEVNGYCDVISSDTVTVMSAIDIIIQKMNSLLIVNDNASTNGGYHFTYYTWYKNGEKVGEGAHDSFGGHYYSGDHNDLDPYSEYWVEVLTTDGKWYRSCPYIPVIKRLGMDVIAYPNPLTSNSSRIVTVEAKGFDRESLEGGIISVYNQSGVLLDRVPVRGNNLTQVPMHYPEGMYIFQFKCDVLQKEIKIIVTK
jgi:hypothetical protein